MLKGITFEDGTEGFVNYNDDEVAMENVALIVGAIVLSGMAAYSIGKGVKKLAENLKSKASKTNEYDKELASLLSQSDTVRNFSKDVKGFHESLAKLPSRIKHAYMEAGRNLHIPMEVLHDTQIYAELDFDDGYVQSMVYKIMSAIKSKKNSVEYELSCTIGRFNWDDGKASRQYWRNDGWSECEKAMSEVAKAISADLPNKDTMRCKEDYDGDECYIKVFQTFKYDLTELIQKIEEMDKKKN